PALAHKVTIFALVKGDTVFTQSKLGGKPAKNAPVVISDAEGHQLFEGKTDEQGAFSFKIPNKKSFKVVVLPMFLRAARPKAAQTLRSKEQLLWQGRSNPDQQRLG
ncbi:MAG: hypothetical protein JRF69_09490, partial [Deltaproteobacteria bacterium]|nr:hypothetical protein [Deltaproteobacteria bacterium]